MFRKNMKILTINKKSIYCIKHLEIYKKKSINCLIIFREEIVNDASWTHDCENAGDLFINYHVLVQNLEVTNDKVELTNPEV